MEKFCRQCSVTGEGMNEGWYIENTLDYIKYEKDLIPILRKVKDVPEGLSDDELREYLYEEDYFCYTEWDSESEIEEQGYYYLEDGTIYVFLENNEKDISIMCPECDQWEDHPIDEQRHHIQNFDYELLNELIDGHQVSKMKCHTCKTDFKLIWNYKTV